MNFFSNKNRVIQSLFIAAVVLLIANLVIGKFTKGDNGSFSEISSEQVNEIFLKTLNNFAIKEEWIKSLKRGDADFNYQVNIPADLPVVVVINEIFNSFQSDKIRINSVEKKLNGASAINISYNNDVIVSAEFRYNNNIFRKAGNVGILLNSFEDISLKSIGEILSAPESFGGVIIPSEDSKDITDSLSFYRKEYALLLNDEITDVNFKLNPDFSASRLKLSLLAIINTFPGAAFIIIDENSALYSSTAYLVVKEGLEKRNIKIVLSGSLKKIDPNNEINSVFNSVVTNTEEGGNKLLTLEAGKFQDVREEISKLRKIGYRFINPSEIVFSK